MIAVAMALAKVLGNSQNIHYPHQDNIQIGTPERHGAVIATLVIGEVIVRFEDAQLEMILAQIRPFWGRILIWLHLKILKSNFCV
jgi:hypothetical protein